VVTLRQTVGNTQSGVSLPPFSKLQAMLHAIQSTSIAAKTGAQHEIWNNDDDSITVH
jgi:hypothetical protein